MFLLSKNGLLNRQIIDSMSFIKRKTFVLNNENVIIDILITNIIKWEI